MLIHTHTHRCIVKYSTHHHITLIVRRNGCEISVIQLTQKKTRTSFFPTTSRAVCLQVHNVGCGSLPPKYDCSSDISHWHHAWSTPKRKFCPEPERYDHQRHIVEKIWKNGCLQQTGMTDNKSLLLNNFSWNWIEYVFFWEIHVGVPFCF